MSQGSPMLTFPALQTWLGKELEVRGIDAVIYTRYILSILQQDRFEVETDPERDLFPAGPHHRKEVRIKGKRQPGKRRRSSWTAEDLKKNAVLECLQSVTGEECGIESLVEELCVKLKKVQEEREKNTSGGSLPGSQSNSPKEKPSSSSTTDSSDTTPVSQAERYYEAFPALSDKTNLITRSDSKPQGAWGSKGGKGKDRSPRDSTTDNTINEKDVTGGRFTKSASVSRSSTSPTHNIKKHQRTNSLPDNVSQEYENPVFIVPKYQTKKTNHGGNGHHHHHHLHHQDGKASVRHSAGNTETSVEKLEARKLRNGRKQKNGHHTLAASLKSITNKGNKASTKQLNTEDSSWYTQPLDVPSEQHEDNLHNSKLQTLYKAESRDSPGNSGDTSLEEAVSSLAESLCRDIMDDYNGDLEELPKDTITKAIKSAAIKCGKEFLEESEGSPSKILKLEGVTEGLPRRRSAEDLTKVRLQDRATADSMFGTSLPIQYDYEFMLSEMQQQGSRVWSIDTLGITDDLQMGGDEADGQTSEDLLGSASFLAAIWQKDLMQDSSTNLWPDTSNQRKKLSPTSQQVESIGDDPNLLATEGDLSGADDDDDDDEKAIPLKVMVEEGSVMVLDGGATTTHLPIGTGRANDSLLRICSPTHIHHHSHDGTFCSEHDEHYRSFTSWSTGDGDASDLQCVPPDALTPEESKGDVLEPTRKDSLIQGIKAVCDLPSQDAQTLDVNSALWATYEAQPRFVQPPKIVRWEDGLMAKKKGAFIEGGVYGSPYSSRNNSHYSSCSTSPADSSIRDLWDKSGSQEGASLLSSSLQKLLSPKLTRERLGSGPIGESTPKSLSPFESTKSADEKSVIEDSLMDSPVFMGSRSSSRFDFARSMSDVGDGSLSPASGTETDEMVSEAEFLEEVMKETGDIRELTENLQGTCNNNNDKVEWSTNTGSLQDVDSTPQNIAGFDLNQGFQVGCNVWGPPNQTSIGSGMLTAIKPVISKPEPVRTTGMRPDPIIARPQDMFRGGGEETKTGVEDLLISPKTHFRPINEGMSPDSVEAEEDIAKNVQLGNVDNLFEPYKVPPPVGCTEWPTGDIQSGYKPPKTSRFGFELEPSPKGDEQWHKGGRWLERELPPTGQLFDNQPLSKGKDVDASITFGVKPTGFDEESENLQTGFTTVKNLPRDRGPADIWDTGGLPAGIGGGGEGGSSFSSGFLISQKAPGRAELEPTSDSEHQMFPYDDEVFLLEEGLLDEPGEIGPRKAYYSSDLEQQWMKESEPVMKLPTKKRKPRGLKYRPCSFFLEGNCRRAGCRFAHDLSRIPCRFWEEGQCLKEEDCPFLHGYPSGYSSQEDSRHASGSESLSRDEEDEQKVPEGLNKLPSITKPKPPPGSADHNSPVTRGETTFSKGHVGLVSSGDTTTQPVPVPAHFSHNYSSNNSSSSGSSSGKPPRSLPIQIVAKTR